MKKICLLMCIFLFVPILAGLNVYKAYAAVNTEVKIGLYFASAAQSQIGISADEGVVFNAFDAAANSYTPVYNSAAGEAVTIRKDSYFTGDIAALEPLDSASGATIGPVHIQIKNIYNSYKETLPVIQAYKQKNIVAYPVYTDGGWCIWTGFYTDKAAAEKDIAAIKAKLGQLTYTVADKSDARIYGVNNSGEILFMYASANKLLRGRSLAASNHNPIRIGNTLYRGQVEFLRKAGSDMTIISILPVEEYLYGVVPSEIEAGSNPEALKAQAVAARTYTYLRIDNPKLNNHLESYGFNLCASIHCQVYSGVDGKNGENANTSKAVDDTKDLVVTYKGQLAETLYFASSGGQTEDGSNVWTGAEYLKSVEDSYESGISTNYNWKRIFTVEELNQKYNLGTVTSIEVTKYSEAGRPVELIVKSVETPEGIIKTKDSCRTFLALPSQWFTVSSNADLKIKVNNKNEDQNKAEKTEESQIIKTPLSGLKVIAANGRILLPDPSRTVTIKGADGISTAVPASPTEFYFEGKGNGHAVGMSQEGAKGMANAGFTFDQILKHYYTGVEIEPTK